MKGLTCKCLLLAAAAALIVLLLPSVPVAGPGAPWAGEAYAGEGIDTDAIIQGLNSDGSVDPGATLSISMSDLESVLPGVKALYEQGKVEISFKKGDFGESEPAVTTYSGGVFSTKVTLRDAGKYIWFTTGCVKGSGFDDSSYNTNDKQREVVGSFTVEDGPALASGIKTITGLLTRDYEFTSDGKPLTYRSSVSGKTYTSDDFFVRLIDTDTSEVLQEEQLVSNKVLFKNVKLSYTTERHLKAQLCFYLGDSVIEGPAFSFSDKAEKLTKNYTYATKLGKNKAFVRWSGTYGASGYYVYQGSKKVKTIKKGSITHTIIKRKGAGKAKFKVVPYVKSGGKTVKGKSTKAKAKANTAKWAHSMNVQSYAWPSCRYVVTKISLKGKTYTVTGYAMNNRIWDMPKYKKLSVSLKVDGRKAFSKTYKNKKVNVKWMSKKKIVLKIKGKPNMDLAHGKLELTVSQKVYWPDAPFKKYG